MSERAGRARGHVRGAMTIVPLALVSAAWTMSMVGVSPTTPVASPARPAPLPDGSSVPSRAIEAPATVSSPDRVGVDLTVASAREIVNATSTAGIPSAALAAYQRAETVIDAADKSCRLPWQLVAAIGRVESNHGRANGNVLDTNGISRPGIYGIPLDGSSGTALIGDTDAGQYDNDILFDRAVGPMQFIPSTWSVVGVDADGDGKRDPQDINDASLATAVYLCSGTDDLATDAGRRSSVFRYNHSQSYVDLVLSIMQEYLDGEFTSVPTSTVVADGIFTPIDVPVESGGNNGDGGPSGNDNNGTGVDPGPGAPTSTAPSTAPTPTADPTPGGGGNDGPTRGPKPTPTPSGNPGPIPSQVPSVTVPSVTTGVPPVDEVLTTAEAVVQCTLDGLVDNPLNDDDKFDQCVELLTTKTPKNPKVAALPTLPGL